MTSPTGRLMSPQMSFSTALKDARATESRSGAKIDKPEAEAALSQLTAHPHATAAERAQIVADFLSSQDSGGLSRAATKVLKDFVKRESQATAPGGKSALDLRVQTSIANKQQQAPEDVVTKRYPSDVDTPPPGGKDGEVIFTTMKFPSDNEDGGPAPEDGGPVMVTRKFPSDNEDGGAAPPDDGGGMMTSMKFPSDNEDSGGAVGGAEPVPTPASPIKRERTEAMKTALDKAESTGLVQWTSSMPIGQRFTTAPLKADTHVDGYNYQVLIPTGANTPTAPQADPNSVDQFWVKRSGGIAGLVRYAGPFSIAAQSPTDL